MTFDWTSVECWQMLLSLGGMSESDQRHRSCRPGRLFRQADDVHQPDPNICLSPWRAGTQHPEDAVQHAPVVYTWHAPLKVGQAVSAPAQLESTYATLGKVQPINQRSLRKAASLVTMLDAKAATVHVERVENGRSVLGEPRPLFFGTVLPAPRGAADLDGSERISPPVVAARFFAHGIVGSVERLCQPSAAARRRGTSHVHRLH